MGRWPPGAAGSSDASIRPPHATSSHGVQGVAPLLEHPLMLDVPELATLAEKAPSEGTMAKIGGTKGWVAAAGVALLVAFAVLPALSGAASAAPVSSALVDRL